MGLLVQIETKPKPRTGGLPPCRDMDEDCLPIAAKGTLRTRECWRLDPMQGYCPFLVAGR